MSGKYKLLSAEPTLKMFEAWFDAERGPETDEMTRFSPAYHAMHAAAPNDATERLVRVLQDARSLLHHEDHKFSLYQRITALLKELCDD